MHIMDAQKIIVATHTAAIARNERASSLHLVGAPGTAKTEGSSQSCEWLCRVLQEPVGLGIHMIAAFQAVDMLGFMMPVKGPTGTLDTMFSTPPWMPTGMGIYVVVPPHYDGEGATDASATSGVPSWYAPGEWTGDVPRYGVVLFDEWGQGEQDVQKTGGEIILNGRLGTRSLPLGWRVLSASNRMSDRSGVQREMLHIINRRCQLDIEPHAPSWNIWSTTQPDYNRPHYMTISFAMQRPDLVFINEVPEGYSPYCTSRSLVRMDRDIRALRTQAECEGNLVPTSNLAREFCSGWIGKDVGGEYFAHLKYFEKIPTIQEITHNPQRAKLPSKRDEQLVCAYQIAHHITEENVDKLFEYTLRLVGEMQLVCVNAAKRSEARFAALRTIPAFGPWLIEHQELLVASYS